MTLYLVCRIDRNDPEMSDIEIYGTKEKAEKSVRESLIEYYSDNIGDTDFKSEEEIIKYVNSKNITEILEYLNDGYDSYTYIEKKKVDDLICED